MATFTLYPCNARFSQHPKSLGRMKIWHRGTLWPGKERALQKALNGLWLEGYQAGHILVVDDTGQTTGPLPLRAERLNTLILCKSPL